MRKFSITHLCVHGLSWPHLPWQGLPSTFSPEAFFPFPVVIVLKASKETWWDSKHVVLWVYLFFCAKKTESSGRNTQTGVASGWTTGRFCMDKRSNGEGGVQGAQACEVDIWVSKGSKLQWGWGGGYCSGVGEGHDFCSYFLKITVRNQVLCPLLRIAYIIISERL